MAPEPSATPESASAATANRLPISAESVLAFLCLCAAAVVCWAFLESTESKYTPTRLLPIAAEATGWHATPAAIEQRLAENVPSEVSADDRDQRKPLWLRIDIAAGSLDRDSVLELRILRFEKARIWIVHPSRTGPQRYEEVDPLGRDGLTANKGGYALALPATDSSLSVVAEVRSYMPGAPQAYLWDAIHYGVAERSFERQGGAVFGSLLILAGFSAIVALLNRDITFLLFSGWLVTSLRIAAINAGWDRYWVQLELQNDLYLAILRVLIAAYGYFTVALFRTLLLNVGGNRVVQQYFKALQACFLLFVVAAPLVDHIQYLRVFWTFAAVGLGTLTAQIVYALFVQRTRLVGWYALSWGSMIVGMASEIGAQSGVVHYPSWMNSQTASVVSALMMGLALADRLRSERDGRLAAQARSLTYLRKYQENFNSMPVGLFGLTVDGTLRLRNPAFDSMFSLANGSHGDAPHIDALLGAGAFEKLVASAKGAGADVEIRSVAGDAEIKWYLARVTLNERLIEGSIQDVSLRKAAEDKLKHLVDHDSLTGLLNRRGLEASIRRAAASAEIDIPCALAYVDLDRFKLINDLHGHATGDALLLQAAARLRLVVRARDNVARIADAFVVVLFDCPEHAVLALTERIREVISERPFDIDGKGLNITASVGVVSIEKSMTTVDAVAAADRACSEAKSRGRNCVVRLTDQDVALKTHLEELKVVADLQQRVPTERYFLEFQPIVALQSPMSSLSFEVLIRMRGEAGQVIPPGKFIGAAERNGLMSQIDRWVLRSTLEWLDNHAEHRDRLAFATINISGASLNDNRFVDDAFAMISEHPLAMPKLCFEITESVALHDLGSTRRFVDRVRMYGSKLALDDFGAGYTSFNYLKEIPADFIKIDGSFVKDINRNPANYAITRTIVELTHELGMRSIAEWAETPDTIASLYDLGVDYGQGYCLARPMAPDLVARASSGGALVRDPQVLALLAERGTSGVIARSRRVRHRDLG